ncbi:MAG TPA: Stp1/IreP family PP2C-type Ser/Thr phosphatase [Chloroflexota bacterium]|nr:Stp1/IreP family PP2C-type Ser/Thr phosphatase [Chloroflexota bacterium]
MRLDIGHRTDIGRRRDHNEDFLGVYQPDIDVETAHRGLLFVVADGMGGYAAGEVASRTAVEAVKQAYYGDLFSDLEDALTRALTTANDMVVQEANRDAERAGMGTTIAVAVLRGNELVAANVGDSRVYVIRKSEIQQLTHDHSWVAELLAVGKITPEEAMRHPMRNVVTRSLGGRPQVDVEVYPRFRVEPGDAILVCSDGLWGMVPGEKILQIIDSLSAQAAADALIAAANEAGGVDNISAIVCRVLGDPTDSDTDRTEMIDPLEIQDTQPISRP